MRASTALLRKFQSSTYHRYASGWNLLGALYLLRLFAKGLRQVSFQKHLFIRAATENPQRIIVIFGC